MVNTQAPPLSFTPSEAISLEGRRVFSLFKKLIPLKLVPSESPDKTHDADRPPAAERGAHGRDLVVEALGVVGGIPAAGGSPPRPPDLARQKESLREWAVRLGLVLNQDIFADKVHRGGQEHDIFEDGGRVIKITRNGVFGLSPGIELALVSSDQDARRFHLWEATPLEYLERLHLQNLLVPGLNQFEGIILQPDGDLAIVTSQPRFDIVPVTTAEIDIWFANLGFTKITAAAYYRAEDNLGIFDAHDKNLIRAGDDLVPFDVIPCHPGGGFLEFIEQTLAAGHHLTAVRTVTT